MVAVGKMTLPGFFDTNAVSGWDFLSCNIVRNRAFPHRWHTIGAVVRYDPVDWMYVQAGITDPQGRRSEMGTNTAFHGPDYTQSMFEVGFKPKIHGRQGNYRFDLWYDPRPMARWDGRGVERDDVGFGLNFDQMLTDKIGAFFRYGWNDERIKIFSHWWSLGGTWRGPISRRPKDVLGFGVGQGIVSGDYKDARSASHTETLLEVYYKVCITEWCSLLFNVETVLNPGANSSNHTAVIPGVRLKLAF